MNIDVFFIVALFVLLAVLIVALVIAVKNNKLNAIREACYWIFLEAEEIYGANKGEEKLEYACGQVYEMFPKWLKLLVDKNTLCDLVQNWFDKSVNLAKDYLDNGILDHSVEGE